MVWRSVIMATNFYIRKEPRNFEESTLMAWRKLIPGSIFLLFFWLSDFYCFLSLVNDHANLTLWEKFAAFRWIIGFNSKRYEGRWKSQPGSGLARFGLVFRLRYCNLFLRIEPTGQLRMDWTNWTDWHGKSVSLGWEMILFFSLILCRVCFLIVPLICFTPSSNLKNKNKILKAMFSLDNIYYVLCFLFFEIKLINIIFTYLFLCFVI